MDVSGMEKALLNDVDNPETVDPSVIQVLDYGYRASRNIEIKNIYSAPIWQKS